MIRKRGLWYESTLGLSTSSQLIQIEARTKRVGKGPLRTGSRVLSTSDAGTSTVLVDQHLAACNAGLVCYCEEEMQFAAAPTFSDKLCCCMPKKLAAVYPI